MIQWCFPSKLEKTLDRATGAIDRGGPWAVCHGRHETTRQEIDLVAYDDMIWRNLDLIEIFWGIYD